MGFIPLLFAGFVMQQIYWIIAKSNSITRRTWSETKSIHIFHIKKHLFNKLHTITTTLRIKPNILIYETPLKFKRIYNFFIQKKSTQHEPEDFFHLARSTSHAHTLNRQFSDTHTHHQLRSN